MPEPRFVAESQSEHSCWNVNDEWIIRTDIDIFQNRKYRCMRDFFSIFFIEPAEGGGRELLARMVSCDVRKRLCYPGTSRQIWRDEMLGTPHGYTGDLDQHSDGEDAIDDKKKPFVLLFDEDGTPRSSLPEDARSALSQSRIHYVLEFVLEDKFRGKGITPEVIFAYQKALRELPGRLALMEAALLLSRAPMLLITEEMERNGRQTRPHRSVSWRFADNYRWAWFETWKPYPIGVPSGLMLMGKRISDRLERKDANIAGEDEEAEEEEETDGAMNDYPARRRKPRSEIEVLRTEGQGRKKSILGTYWWYNGRQYLITSKTLPEDAEEGNLQQQMWLEMIKSRQTKQHPHARIIGPDRHVNMKWWIDGILGERDHEGEIMYFVEWCDIIHEGQRYHPPPTWEDATTVGERIIRDWHAIEAEQKGMLRRKRPSPRA